MMVSPSTSTRTIRKIESSGDDFFMRRTIHSSCASKIPSRDIVLSDLPKTRSPAERSFRNTQATRMLLRSQTDLGLSPVGEWYGHRRYARIQPSLRQE